VTISHSSHFHFCIFDEIVYEKVNLNTQSCYLNFFLVFFKFLFKKILTFGKALEMAQCPHAISINAVSICHIFDHFLLKNSILLLSVLLLFFFFKINK